MKHGKKTYLKENVPLYIRTLLLQYAVLRQLSALESPPNSEKAYRVIYCLFYNEYTKNMSFSSTHYVNESKLRKNNVKNS